MVTHYLATVLGWYLVIVSIHSLVRADYVKQVLGDFVANRGLIFLIAVITLVFGLLIVASHNIWVKNWEVVITIFGWVLLVSGIIRLFFPEYIMKSWKALKDNEMLIRVGSLITLAIGLYLLYNVYYIH